ncbi:MAG TPA: hypothetical protein VD833_14780 [Vicinamibacterales bacterium]|nr:hypothetical protein [Vicinamibacterales bacterium]
MNRFDEVLIVNPGEPDGEGERAMYGYYADAPMYYGYGGYVDPYAGYAEYPDALGYYGYAQYPDPGLYGYGQIDPALYGYNEVDPGDGYGQIDPAFYGYGEAMPPEYVAPELAEYGVYGEDPYTYGEVDPYGYGEPEMVGWGQADTITMDEDPSTYYAEADPELGAYMREMHPAPGNAVCPIVGSVIGDPDELGAYVPPARVGPTCGSFTPQPGAPPPVPDTFKPLW